MKTPKTVSKVRWFFRSLVVDNLFFEILVAWARLLLWIILFALVFIGIGLWSESFASPPSAQEMPPIPPIEERVGYEINQVPANFTVIYANGLRVAYPYRPSTNFKYDEIFEEQGGLWYFRSECTSDENIVWPTPTFYRWGDNQRWVKYIQNPYPW